MCVCEGWSEQFLRGYLPRVNVFKSAATAPFHAAHGCLASPTPPPPGQGAPLHFHAAAVAASSRGGKKIKQLNK